MTPNELLQKNVKSVEGMWNLKGDAGDHLPEVCRGTTYDLGDNGKRRIWSHVIERNNRVKLRVFKDDRSISGEYVAVILYSYIPVAIVKHFGDEVAFPSRYVIDDKYFTEMLDYLNDLRREVDETEEVWGMDDDISDINV